MKGNFLRLARRIMRVIDNEISRYKTARNLPLEGVSNQQLLHQRKQDMQALSADTLLSAYSRLSTSDAHECSESSTANDTRQAISRSAEAVLVCRAGSIVHANAAAARMLGMSGAHRLMNRSVFEFVSLESHRALAEVLAAPAVPCFQEQQWQRSGGTRFDAELALSELHFEDAPALQIVIRDISTRKRSEALQLGQNRILNMLATGMSLSQVLNALANYIEQFSSGGLCSILLLDSQGMALTQRVAPSLPRSYLERAGSPRVGPQHGSCGTAVHRKEPVIVTDIATDPLWESRRELALEYGLRACTSWPIFGRDGRVLGAFALYFKTAVAPAPEDLELFSVCTKLAGIAIERHGTEERIRALAHYDGLTGLANRFLFQEYLDQALRNAQRRRTRFAVLFLDLDRFKEINDTLGHDAGDQTLQEVACRLRSCLRDCDRIARMGGDEFYVLIEDLKCEHDAEQVAAKLLEAITQPVWIEGRECQLGVSIGAALYPNDGVDGKTLLMNADNAMYRVKESGRNGFRFHASSSEQSAARTPESATLP